jgi:hypothetical protein
VVIRTVLIAAAGVLAAGGYLPGPPADAGILSGALKHFLDGIYDPGQARPDLDARWEPGVLLAAEVAG